MLLCKICNAPAKSAEDGKYRHAGEPWEDGSGFCDKYGYPIEVVDTEWKGSPEVSVVDETQQKIAAYLVSPKASEVFGAGTFPLRFRIAEMIRKGEYVL